MSSATIVSDLNLDLLEAVARKLSGIKNIHHDEDSVLFTFHDKDGDDVTGFFQILNKTQLRGILALPVPDTHLVSAMISTVAYNARPDIHSTYACISKISDKSAVCLEMDLDSEGGISEAHLAHKLQAFVDHINLFETKIFDQIKELGEDSSFLKGGFFNQLGAFFAGVIQGMSD